MYFISSSHNAVPAVTVLSNLAPRIRQRRGENPDGQTRSRRPAPGPATAGHNRRLGSSLAQRESLAQNAGLPDVLIRRLVCVLVIAVGATLPGVLAELTSAPAQRSVCQA